MSTIPYEDCGLRIAAAAPTAESPWVELRNTCKHTVDAEGEVLRWAGHDWAWGAAALHGEVAPGGCLLVTEFDQPLLHGDDADAGLALFTTADDALTDVPHDRTIYGWSDVADVPPPEPYEHIELDDGAWAVADGARSACAGKAPTIPPVLDACAPDVDMCDQLHAECQQAGVDPERCDILGGAICRGDRCLGCEQALTECDEVGGDCDAIAALCDDNLEACGCESVECKHAGKMSFWEVFSFCFAFPVQDCGIDLDVGQCFALMQWDGCKASTCEWRECAEDMAALKDSCPEKLPHSCEVIQACDEAEQQTKPAAGSLGPQAPIIGDAPTDPAKCIKLSEVLYRPKAGPAAGAQWVRVKNICSKPVDLAKVEIRYTDSEYGWWFGFRPLGELGKLAPKSCAVIGGPTSSAANGWPSFDLKAEYYKPLTDPLVGAAGIGLAFIGKAVPFDAVLYGSANLGDLVDESGFPGTVDLPRVGAGHSMLRVGGAWADNAAPSPNNCG